ncbi:MAG: hypothetical protein NTV54_08225 [Ignavibacteriales bacterium]|nr:hypothetical protein [Ignavibacteriales bacterium]
MKKILAVALALMLVATSALAQRVLLKDGDQYAGVKLALGSIGGASIGYVASYERGIQDNIGVGGTIAYSGYSEDYFGWGKWKYTNIFIAVNGTYHYDVLKNEKLDTWGGLLLGYNAASVSWDGPGGSYVSPTAGGIVFGLSANGRYFVTDKLAVAASIGVGMGILSIGVDYKF